MKILSRKATKALTEDETTTNDNNTSPPVNNIHNKEEYKNQYSKINIKTQKYSDP